jgi:hypothetical protein
MGRLHGNGLGIVGVIPISLINCENLLAHGPLALTARSDFLNSPLSVQESTRKGGQNVTYARAYNVPAQSLEAKLP